MTRTSGAAAAAAVAGGGTVPVVVPPPVCLVLGTTPIGPVAGYCPLDRILNFFFVWFAPIGVVLAVSMELGVPPVAWGFNGN